MSKKRYLTGGLLGLAALGACIGGAIAGQFDNPNKKLALELVNATSGLLQSTAPVSLFLNNGFPSNAKITINLGGGAKFIVGSIGLCHNNVFVATGTVSGTENATVELTSSASVGGSQWLILARANSGDNCNNPQNFDIKIPGTVSDGSTITISGSVSTGEPITAGTLYTIKQQTSAKYEKGTSYIAYDHGLKKFTGGVTQSNATLYIVNGTDLDIYAENGNFTIEVAGDMTGVANGIWGNSTHNCTLALNSERTKLTNSACPMSNVTNSKNTVLTINIYGNETLTARKFYTTVKTKADNNRFAREITLLNNALTHEWILAGTTFYIPFVRHNAAQNIFTTIKLQARSTAGITSYPISVQVLRSDGSMQDVAVCGGTLTAGQTCEIKGDVLTTAAGKEETFAIINVNGPEDSITCFAVYNYQGQSRRIPCKVKGGTIVE